jgi:uncharacterized cupin superfamily protein
VSDGWYVVNAREAKWYDRGPRGSVMRFVEDESQQIAVNLFMLGPGEPMSMYHWEDVQEGFLVLSGAATLVIESEERPLKQWDYVHCPPNVAHTIVGGPATILALGGFTSDREGALGYPLDETAARHGAASEEETSDQRVAYARFERPAPTAFRDEFLP